MAARSGDASPARVRVARLEAFSDGVFAIAITLLVLDLQVPEASDGNLLRGLAEQWPVYLAYVISFAFIGGVWLAHTSLTDHLLAASTVLLRLNLLLLLTVSFLPFPTRVLAGYGDDADGQRTAVTMYGVVLLLSSTMVLGLWRTALAEDLVDPDMSASDRAVLTRRFTPGVAAYLLVIGVGLVLPTVAVFGYLAIALLLLVPPALWRGQRTSKSA